MSLTSAEAIDLVQKLGFPIVIAGVFAYFGWNILNRFIGHMEKAAEKQDAVNEKFTGTLSEISSTMKTVAQSQQQNMAEFRSVAPTICRNWNPKP